jgi:hypothetical protein
VTTTFITAQSRVLAQRGFLKKREDAADRRVSRLSLTRKGGRLVDEIVEGVRPINDIFFGGLEKGEFVALSAVMGKLVDSKPRPLSRSLPRIQRHCFRTETKGYPTPIISAILSLLAQADGRSPENCPRVTPLLVAPHYHASARCWRGSSSFAAGWSLRVGAVAREIVELSFTESAYLLVGSKGSYSPRRRA